MSAKIDRELTGLTKDELRQLAEEDLYIFARLVNPHRVYGECHKELFYWWMKQEDEGVDNTLCLMPRDHQKSHCAAVKAAWMITRDPATTILYISATENLAKKQVRAIKGILESDVYQYYWPDMINEEVGQREKWTETDICVDHPLRKKEGVRDSTLEAGGLTKTITGLHCKHIFLDDLVVPQNAYTEEGREKVMSLYSQLASIETTGSTETCVGTRYHPKDLYQYMMDMAEPIFNESWEIIGEQPVYGKLEKVVEIDGKFLWPKEYREDGKPFGFDWRELARKKAKYLDRTQFYAQYYNDPNDPESDRLSYSDFQYYDRDRCTFRNGRLYINGSPVNVTAHIDFAYTTGMKSDYTAIAVVGMDANGNVYVLDLDRFKTDKIGVMYDHIEALHYKWNIRKLRAEVTAAQGIIVKDLKMKVSQAGLPMSILDARPNRAQGSKEERIAAVLEPRYENGTVFHFKGGLTPALEEELVLARPAHDDLKDALAGAVEILKPANNRRNKDAKVVQFKSHPRFGGRV